MWNWTSPLAFRNSVNIGRDSAAGRGVVFALQ